MEHAILTIVTVVRNAASTLEETILSVRAIVPMPHEHLIVDGASTDGTVEVIRRHAAIDPSIRWISAPDRGIYDAMNRGWSMASPESLILFLGAGDRIISLPPLEKCPPDQVVYGDVEIDKRLFRGEAGWWLRISNTLHHQALLVPRRLHPEPPFDLRFRLYADFDLNQRLLKGGVPFRYDPALRAVALPGGVSSRKDRGEMLRVVRKNFGIGWMMAASFLLPVRMAARVMTEERG